MPDAPHGTFDDFYRSAYPSIVRSLALAVGDVDAARDAAQEGFLRAYRRWNVVRRTDRPDSWVYVVAVRHHRRTTRRRPPPRDPPDTGRDPGRGVLDVEGAIALDAALRSLTERQRSMIVLRFHVDLPVKDIASAMGCAEGTVKATLHQALKALRLEFDEEDLG